MNSVRTVFAIVALCTVVSRARADSRGEIVETDTLGMNVISHNVDKPTTTYVTDAQNLSEFVGLHYFFVAHVRIGMNLQFTERIAPDPAAGTSRFQTFALLPQIGWHFYRSLFAALTITLAPRSGGTNTFDGGVQGVFGTSFELSSRVRGSLAVEIPVDFTPATKVGLTPLVGISINL